ncbi:hypothetical protein CALCODRAFT_520573 [Calocera cornea HHB12733]|uniref:BRCT domain-containing protein n=1 Tax=Calocera cornea HHB12733 TaxID=1353952 RepID=A0A165DEZ1_9BASI|nr:hypothetical protein CALCODRAFT_520573 [Calocera cornea HHB12733]
MQTRASGSRPVRAVRKQAPPTAFRAPPRATATATQQDILAPIKDHDHVPRDVGKVGPPARPSLSKMSSEAQTSLSNLSAALSKLSLPPPAPRSNSRLSFHEESGKREKPASQTSVRSAPATTTKNHARKPSVRNIANSFPNSQKSSTLALLANPVTVMVDAANPSMDASTSAGATPRMLSPLAGCVVFVDVRTKDGDDAGGVFVEMLKALGARVLKSPTPSLTHLVLKSPLPHTITRYHTLPDPKPEVVAVGWVVKCAEEAQRVDVADWRLDLSAGAGVVSAIPGCSTRPSTRSFVSRGGPRRISMEPRRVELLDEANLSHIALPMLELRDKVERAKRQSLLYQPKFSSPLRTNAYLANRGDEDGFEVDQA